MSFVYFSTIIVRNNFIPFCNVFIFITSNMKNKKLKILLNVNLAFILLLIILLCSFFIGLTAGNDIDPVIIIGSLIIVAALLYSLVFFAWNLVIYITVFIRKIIKRVHYRNTIIILIAAVVIPYFLLLILWLMAATYG